MNIINLKNIFQNRDRKSIKIIRIIKNNLKNIEKEKFKLSNILIINNSIDKFFKEFKINNGDIYLSIIINDLEEVIIENKSFYILFKINNKKLAILNFEKNNEFNLEELLLIKNTINNLDKVKDIPNIDNEKIFFKKTKMKYDEDYNKVLINFIDDLEPNLKSVYYIYKTLQIFSIFEESVESRKIYNDLLLEKYNDKANILLENMSESLIGIRKFFNNEMELFVKKITTENTKKDFYDVFVLPSTEKNLLLSSEEEIIKELSSNLILLKSYIDKIDPNNKKDCYEFVKLVDDIKHFIHQTVNIISMLSLKLLSKVIKKELEKHSIIKDNRFFLEMFESIILRILKFEKQLQELKLISLNKDEVITNIKEINVSDIKKYFKLIDNQKHFLYKEKYYEINVLFNIKDKNLKLKTDYDKIIESIETLLQNAYEELSEKEIELENNYEKTIMISIYEENNEICFSIKDNGRGISEENRTKIFEKYFTTGKRDGSGIGLAAVIKIMDILKGKVELNTEINVGTEFILRIPKI